MPGVVTIILVEVMDGGEHRSPRLVNAINFNTDVIQHFYYLEQACPAVGDFIWLPWNLALSPVVHQVPNLQGGGPVGVHGCIGPVDVSLGCIHLLKDQGVPVLQVADQGVLRLISRFRDHQSNGNLHFSSQEGQGWGYPGGSMYPGVVG